MAESDADRLAEITFDWTAGGYAPLCPDVATCAKGHAVCAIQWLLGQLEAALEACEVSMDTAAVHGVGSILPPAYRDSWARALLEGQP